VVDFEGEGRVGVARGASVGANESHSDRASGESQDKIMGSLTLSRLSEEKRLFFPTKQVRSTSFQTPALSPHVMESQFQFPPFPPSSSHKLPHWSHPIPYFSVRKLQWLLQPFH
jgi:hypothetical protein